MAKVFIVSNRLPINVKKVNGKLKYSSSLGGLATGLSSYANNRNRTWIGWPGIASEELDELEKQQISKELAKHHCRPVFLSRKQIDSYYNGFSNGVLWPLFHNLPIEKVYLDNKYFKAYERVNQLFADTVLSISGPNSTIWVHDYQLLLLPEMLRAEYPSAQIGFFLHIPFPTVRSFTKLKTSQSLIIGMLGADLIGFHTNGYSRQFLQSCIKYKVGIVGKQEVILPTRSVRVTKFPIGVDYQKYAHARKLKAVKEEYKNYKKKYGKCRLIVAVDRLEPSKGLIERLKAYNQFLSKSPQLIGKVVFVMVAAPSRMDLAVYQKLKSSLSQLSKEINNTYGTKNWQPVDFINRPLAFEQVTALYQLADVAFIAPLRDGMNLVAKEYVATKRQTGVLILSQTAGAAEELQDALIVNPFKPSSLVAALQQSMVMPKPELRRRLKNMQTQVSGNTIQSWANTFINTLNQPVPGTRPKVKEMKGRNQLKLVSDYRLSQNRLLLLDYDGTLVPFNENFKNAKPSTELLLLLRKLSQSKSTDVVIISGRRASDLDKWLGNLKINFVAEHGAMIKTAKSSKWKTIEKVDTKWKRDIMPILDKYTALTPKSAIEVKPHSLVWHYRSSPNYYAQKYAVIIKHVLKPIVAKNSIRLYQGNKILEIKDPRVNKSEAAQFWINKKPDFIMAVGDDYTDEDLFSGISELTEYSIKIGSGKTYAKYRIKNTAQVSELLNLLAAV